MDKEGERFRGVTWVRVSFWASRRLGARLGAARQFPFDGRAYRRGAGHAGEFFFFVAFRRSRRDRRFVSWRPFFCIKIAAPRALLQRLLLQPSSGAAGARKRPTRAEDMTTLVFTIAELTALAKNDGLCRSSGRRRQEGAHTSGTCQCHD